MTHEFTPDFSRGKRGFSLVELLIALSIISAITAIIVGVYQPVVGQQRYEMLRSNLA